MACLEVAQALLVILIAAGVFVRLGASPQLVAGAAALVFIAFLTRWGRWLFDSWGRIFSPRPPALQPGPSPAQMVVTPLQPLGRIVLLCVGIVAFFAVLGPGQRSAVLDFLGAVAAPILEFLGGVLGFFVDLVMASLRPRLGG